jgi:hypothetical protein
MDFCFLCPSIQELTLEWAIHEQKGHNSRQIMAYCLVTDFILAKAGQYELLCIWKRLQEK